jgi:uncharacterized RDD family membrane protein YckC
MNVVPASYGARVGAYLIDGIVPFVLFIPSLIASASATSMLTTGNYEGVVSATQAGLTLEWIAVVLLLLFGLFQIIAEANTGMTIGKRAVGLRTVRADTLGLGGFGRILGRYVIIALGGFVLIGQYLVLLSPLWDSERRNRGWHDKASNTWVLDVKNGLNPLLPTVAQTEPVTAVAPGIVSVGMPSLKNDTGPEPTPPTVIQTEVLAEPVIPVAAGTGGGLIVGVPGFVPVTQVAPVATPPAENPVSANVIADDDDDGGRTRAATRAELRPRGAVLRLDSGEEFPISGSTLLGRNPAPDTGEEQVGLVSITDTTRALSKTHAAIGIDGLRLWVSDRNSTNGTRVRRLDGTEQAVSSTERVYFAPGETVVLGDRALEVRWQA